METTLEFPEPSTVPAYKTSSTDPRQVPWAMPLIHAFVGTLLGIAAGLVLAIGSTAMPFFSTASNAPVANPSDVSAALPLQPSTSATKPADSVQHVSRSNAAVIRRTSVSRAHSQTRRHARSLAKHFASSPQAEFPTAPVSTFESADASKPSNASAFTVEGFIQVVGYDPNANTLETVDGRIFVLDAMASDGLATSWENYRANVHYKCSQDGSCVLYRPGMVVDNVKLI